MAQFISHSKVRLGEFWAVNGRSVEAPVSKGYATVDRTWNDGDTLALSLSMPVERVYANRKVRHDFGKVAMQRGPLVFCLEEADNGPDLHRLRIPRQTAVRASMEETDLGVIPVIRIKGKRRSVDGCSDALYDTDVRYAEDDAEIKAIPYYLWANRGMGEMTVWIDEGPPA